MTQRRRHPGFLLIEIIIAMALLTVFALLATRLFVSSMRSIEQSGEQINLVIRFDGMLRALRGDIWSGTSIGRVTHNALIVQTRDAGDVRWTIDPDGRITRSTDHEAPRSFPPAAPGAHFAQIGGVVALVVGDEPIVMPNLKELSRQ